MMMARKGRIGWIALGFAVVMVGAVTCCAGPGEVSASRRAELELLLNVPEVAFDAAMEASGGVSDQDALVLAHVARSWIPGRRRRAADIFRFANRKATRDLAVALLADTDDVVVWASVITPQLRFDPEAEALAAARPDMVEQALASSDPAVLAAGVWAAAITGRGDRALFEAAFDHSSGLVVEAGVRGLARYPEAAPRLGQALAFLDVKRANPFLRSTIAEALADAPGGRAAVEAALRQQLQSEDRSDHTQAQFLIGTVADGKASWVGPWLVEQARAEHVGFETALHALSGRDDPASLAALLEICGEARVRRPDDDRRFGSGGWSLTWAQKTEVYCSGALTGPYPKEQVDLLYAKARGDDAGVRLAAAAALVRLRLNEVSIHEDGEAAAPSPEHVPATIESLLLTTDDPEVWGMLALWHGSRRGDNSLQDIARRRPAMLEAALKSDHPDVRRGAESAIRSMQPR